MSDTVREPQQQRSIDKKNKIIKSGYELFSEVGYYSTNTAEIAKRAGVSTGIVYGYFKDKRDILLDVLEIYVSNVFTPIIHLFDALTAPVDFDTLIPQAVESAIEAHRQNANIHEALHSMAATDEAVNKKFIDLEDSLTTRLTTRFEQLGVTGEDVAERIHLSIAIVQAFAHECVYDRHQYLDYERMHALCIKTVKALFE